MTDKPAESAVERWERYEDEPIDYNLSLPQLLQQCCDTADAAIAELLARIEQLSKENRQQRIDWMERMNAIELERKGDEATNHALMRAKLNSYNELRKRADDAEALVERLKCCGSCRWCDSVEYLNCDHEVVPERERGEFYVSLDDRCHHEPSRWTARSKP